MFLFIGQVNNYVNMIGKSESPPESLQAIIIWRADFQNLLHLLLHVTHLQIRSQQRSQFSTQTLLQMENVDTNWNLE